MTVVATVPAAMSGSLVAGVPGNIRVTEMTIVTLMLVAAVVAIGVSRMRVPYTIALVLVGVGLGASGAFDGVKLTGDLIFLVFLPPLLFEGALNLDLGELRRRWFQVSVLAGLGTVVAAVVIAIGLVGVLGIPLRYAALLAVILAPTDPVSVLAILKESGITGGLRTLLEAESIFNDALGFVLYAIAVEIAFPTGATTTVAHALWQFTSELGIGLGIGVVCGLVSHRLMATLDDHLVEITLSLVTAFGAFLAATELGGSGLIATVVAGLLIGNFGTDQAMTETSRAAVIEFWDVIVFLANSAIFLLIGMRFHPSQLGERGTALAAAVCIVTVFVGRAFIAYGLFRPFISSDADPGNGQPVPPAWIPAIFWGGLRGTVPIALVLGLDETRFAGIDASAVVFATVVVSLVLQGVTYRPLLLRLGLTSGLTGATGTPIRSGDAE